MIPPGWCLGWFCRCAPISFFVDLASRPPTTVQQHFVSSFSSALFFCQLETFATLGCFLSPPLPSRRFQQTRTANWFPLVPFWSNSKIEEEEVEDEKEKTRANQRCAARSVDWQAVVNDLQLQSTRSALRHPLCSADRQTDRHPKIWKKMKRLGTCCFERTADLNGLVDVFSTVVCRLNPPGMPAAVRRQEAEKRVKMDENRVSDDCERWTGREWSRTWWSARANGRLSERERRKKDEWDQPKQNREQRLSFTSCSKNVCAGEETLVEEIVVFNVGFICRRYNRVTRRRSTCSLSISRHFVLRQSGDWKVVGVSRVVMLSFWFIILFRCGTQAFECFRGSTDPKTTFLLPLIKFANFRELSYIFGNIKLTQILNARNRPNGKFRLLV